MTEAKILEDFSELTSEDIKACLAFAYAIARKKKLALLNEIGLAQNRSLQRQL